MRPNDYTTSMTGLKFKVAYKKADNGKWSASANAQRRRMIKFLEDVIDDLEKQQADEPEKPKKTAAKTRRWRRAA